MKTKEKQILEFFLPEGALQWFDIKEGERTNSQIKIVLEEKNIPPISEKERGKKVIARGFTKIMVDDFPVRGRKVILVFYRRYWQVEGQDKLLKRDIVLCAKGTQLEKEFAAFLKEQVRN